MRIALFSDTYPPDINGVATSTANLYRTFIDHGDEVLVLTTNPTSPRKFSYEADLIRMPGMLMKHLYGYVLSNFWNRKAVRILRNFNPDVFHIQTDGPIGQFGFLCAKRLKVPTVYTYHTMIEDYTYYVTNDMFFDRAARAVVRGYVRFKSKEADEFITPSPKIADYMRTIGVDSYLSVVPTGIDFSRFEEKNMDLDKLESLRQQYGIKKDDFVVVSLGRVAKEKSIDLTIDGFERYLEKYPNNNVKFLIAGGGPALPELREKVEKLNLQDRILFTDRVEPYETQYYYHLGNCFVSASTTETQGLTFMEGMACSLPLLVRYDESLTGLIQNEKNGFFYFDCEEFADQLERIRTLSEKERNAIIQNAFRTLDIYSLERFYRAVREVYVRAIKKNY